MARKETFSRFDAAEYLKTEEDMALYLDAMIEERANELDVTRFSKLRGVRIGEVSDTCRPSTWDCF